MQLLTYPTIVLTPDNNAGLWTVHITKKNRDELLMQLLWGEKGSPNSSEFTLNTEDFIKLLEAL